MNVTTIKTKIYLEDLSLEEAQMFKQALLYHKKFQLKDPGQKNMCTCLYDAIDQAIDKVMGSKYAGKVFGGNANVEHVNV